MCRKKLVHDLNIDDRIGTNTIQPREVNVLAVREGEGRQIHIIYEMCRLMTDRQARKLKKRLCLSVEQM